MIVTKARDNQLTRVTRELALWLMKTPRDGKERGLIVCVLVLSRPLLPPSLLRADTDTPSSLPAQLRRLAVAEVEALRRRRAAAREPRAVPPAAAPPLLAHLVVRLARDRCAATARRRAHAERRARRRRPHAAHDDQPERGAPQAQQLDLVVGRRAACGQAQRPRPGRGPAALLDQRDVPQEPAPVRLCRHGASCLLAPFASCPSASSSS